MDSFFKKDSEVGLLENILKNTKRYQKMFCEIIDSILPEKTGKGNLKEDEIETVGQLFLNQRTTNIMNNPDMKNTANSKNQNIPPELKRN